LSGFSALLYQILWQRILTLFSGGDVFAATIMVAVFMAGLGFGSSLGGQIADRINRYNAVKFFALCEIGIALFAAGSVWLYHNVLLEYLSPLAHSRLSLALILFAGFLVPTVFMGMSLPFLSKSISENIDAAPRVISKLYAFNTLGAALGAFITTWLLIRNLGIEPSIWIGAVLNLVCGLGALAYVKNKKDLDVARQQIPLISIENNRPIFLYLLIYSLSGFLALSLEILWFRFLGVVLKSSTFVFGHLLSIYLLGFGMGSLVGIRWSANKKFPWPLFLLIQSAIATYSVLMIIVLINAAEISAFPSFWKYLVAYDPLDLESVLKGSLSVEFFTFYFLIPLILIFPATFLMGLSYPLLQRVIQTDLNFIGRRVGWLQTASYTGSVLGAFATGLLFLTIFGTVRTFLILLCIPFLFLVILLFNPSKNFVWKVASVAGMFVLAMLIWKMPSTDRVWGKLHGVDEKAVLTAENYSGLAILRASKPDYSAAIIFSNGIGIGEIPYFKFHILLGMVPVMLHPDPKDVAIIGLGSGATLFGAGGRKETKELTCFEIVSSQKSMLEKFAPFHKPTQTLLNDARIHYEFGDARLLLRRTEKKYDVIETDPIRPDGSYSGNVYSEQYFSLLKQKLKPGGFAVNWAPTPRTAYTFIKVFPHVLYLWMPGAIMIGSNEPIEWDPHKIKARLEGDFSRNHYGAGELDIDAYLHQILIQQKHITPQYDRSTIGDFNTDLYPKDEYLVSQTEEFP
jgi:predicted membrane-bound spermidine synthase